MGRPKLSAIDLNLLVVLDALLETGNLTRAAKRLSLSQPATSHALARLRETFGDPLFVRSARGLIPTPRAEALRPQLRAALDAVRATIEGPPRFEPATSTRVFDVGADDYAASVLVPRVAARLAATAPHTSLFVRAAPDEPRLAHETGTLDLSIHADRRGQRLPGLVCEPLFEERFVCILRRDHPLGRRPLTLDRFCSLGHVLIAPRSATRSSFLDELLAQMGRSRHIAVAVPHFLVAPLVVAQTDLVLTVPERVARLFTSEHGLRVVPPPLEIFPFDLTMQWHPRHEHDAGHAFLREALRVAAGA